VNAAGLWPAKSGRWSGAIADRGHGAPLPPHRGLAELQQLPGEIPLVLDLDGEIYLRQERKGILLGVYEKEATPWALNGTPWSTAR